MTSRRFDISTIEHLIIAGWTGRNDAAVEAHIRELEELGLPRPSRTPIFYRVAAALLTQNDSIEVVGEDTSGEVEFVLVKTDDGWCVGLGSDHTDRTLELTSVALSKQVCAKVVAHDLWRLNEVAPHWDRLMLRSWAHNGGERVLYQEGSVAAMRDPRQLIEMYEAEAGALASGSAMFCGTLPAIGRIRPADAFEMSLEDPVLGRRLDHAYRIVTLPVES